MKPETAELLAYLSDLVPELEEEMELAVAPAATGEDRDHAKALVSEFVQQYQQLLERTAGEEKREIKRALDPKVAQLRGRAGAL